jgi:hypothetical protein
MSKPKSNLTAERLREVLHYDPETGFFTWLCNRGRAAKSGQMAGNISKSLGYRMVMIDQCNHYGHRLAYLYMTGALPLWQIDHIDGDRTNNRFANLRDVPQGINLQNRRAAQPNNKLGLLGVVQRGNRFSAQITLNRKSIPLGVFDTPKEAHEAYLKKKREIHHGNTL